MSRSTADRKRRTREHVIADLGVNYLERKILDCGWAAQRVSSDYGVDLIMTTFDAQGMIQNGSVSFQVKATDSPGWNSTGDEIVIRLDWRDVLYWLNERMPIILIVYDASRDCGYWLYLQAALRSATRRRSSRIPIRLSVRVPAANRLNATAVRRFAEFGVSEPIEDEGLKS
jgi:hypothetical protein